MCKWLSLPGVMSIDTRGVLLAGCSSKYVTAPIPTRKLYHVASRGVYTWYHVMFTRGIT